MNWLHRLGAHKRPAISCAPRDGNLLLAFIRSRLAHAIVYQSQFSRQWWERRHGASRRRAAWFITAWTWMCFHRTVPSDPPAEGYRLLLVEGSLMGGYEQGLEAAEALAYRLSTRLGGCRPRAGQQIELVVGRAHR